MIIIIIIITELFPLHTGAQLIKIKPTMPQKIKTLLLAPVK